MIHKSYSQVIMFKNFPNNLNLKTLILLGIIILICTFSTLPFPWNESIENALVDLQFKVRGDRQLADNIVLVFISAEDIKALNEWPITRDYYSYMTYVLNSRGAKVIGIDLLFNQPDLRHPEYDVTLAEFFQSTNNVCLPMAFSELTFNQKKSKKLANRLMTGHEPAFPIKIFKDHSTGLGFSNFGKEAIVRKVPLVAACGDSFMPSFGCELARLFLDCSGIEINSRAIDMVDSVGHRYSFPIDHYGRLRLNHFGDIDNITAIGFVDLLKTFEAAPDSINFEGKLVLVAVTAPGRSALKATSLAAVLPAVLIHATVAENLMQQNYLHELQLSIHWILITLLVILARLAWRTENNVAIVIANVGIILGYWIIAMLVFSVANYILPLFYPTLAYVTAMSYLGIMRSRQRQLQDFSIKRLLEDQVTAKEDQLEEAKSKLAELQLQLEQEATISEQTQQLAEERKNAILKLEKEIRDLQTHIIKEKQHPQIQFAEIVYAKDSKMAYVLELVARVRSDDIAVLIMGETGTGKEMIARAIHQTSMRQSAAFVAINCGALPETLLDSELFGHEKGSFTGAQSRRRGRFELANGGTLFLDEITETNTAFQARLLRVLQEGTFERVGGEQTIKANVRVIAATNKDLQTEMENQRFRSDLFYRLNGFPITIPPLRERLDDIPLLAIHFLKKHGYQSVSAFSDRAMEILQSYRWPGNVRELENTVRRAAILAQSEGRNIIRENDLPWEILKSESIQKTTDVYKPLETQILDSLRFLKFSRSAISRTAKAAGNRDRGTITEYFRGICFEHLVKAEYNVQIAASAIAATTEEQVIERVQTKINEYLNNLHVSFVDKKTDETVEKKLSSLYKGLPKKYHPYLKQVIEHLKNITSQID